MSKFITTFIFNAIKNELHYREAPLKILHFTYCCIYLYDRRICTGWKATESSDVDLMDKSARNFGLM